MIYGDRNTKVLVQGATGNQGKFHIKLMNEYAKSVGGCGVVAGVTPGKGGQEVLGVPVFDSVKEAVEETGATTSVLFVPGKAAGDSIMEAAYNGLDLVVAITEHIPVHDAVKAIAYAKQYDCSVIGPNCPGTLTPGEIKLGIMPAHLAVPGNVGVISRSGTLTYEVVNELTMAGIGQSSIIGIGGDPVIGQSFSDVIERFSQDKSTRAVVLIGEVGGNPEEEGAKLAKEYDIPVISYIAGISAPPEKRMGHAGAIVSGGEGDAKSKVKRLKELGIPVAGKPSDIPVMLKEIL